MRKLYLLIATLVLTQVAFAQWPANYGGVMLQAFYWDSYEDTQWRNLTSQADELSKYFDLLWVPQSGNCGSNTAMGYMPVYWLDHRSSFGSRQRYLTEMIKAYKDRGTKIIEDVVINHKAPVGKNGSWIDFADEKVTDSKGVTYELTWSGADICQNDDGGYTKSQGWDVTGANDTGDDFSGGRDLDHTSANVQKNVKTYLRFLMDSLGYAGFRLDMVKGYGAEFTKLYNEAVKPEFCVGEYWDGSFAAVTGWINGTGKTSAAFDFPLKYVIRDAFGGGNWGALSNKGIAGSPDWNQYSVTFIDNHDTYENQDRLTNNVLAANAFILAMPGTPCIFLKHWQRYPIAIGNMVLARKACGLTNQSPIVEQGTQGNGYVIKTQGSKGTVLCMSGYVQGYNTDGFKLITSGTNFAYYVSDNVTIEGLREGNDDDDPSANFSVFVEAAEAPYLYAWTPGGANPMGAWPGTLMTQTAEIGEKTFWKQTFTVAPVNVIFHNNKGGNENQTADINGLTHNSYFTYDGANGYTDITDQYYTPPTVQLPDCVKAIEGHIYCYFRGNKDYDKPYVWAWKEGKDFCKNAWPGDAMKKVGSDNGAAVWLWDLGEVGDDGLPTGILFSNEGSETLKTADMKFQNGGYYDVYGMLGAVTGIKPLQVSSSKFQVSGTLYNMQGQKVNDNYRGLVIQNGRKTIKK